MKAPKQFLGFTPETLKFLQGLKENNNRMWFDAHKVEYQTHLFEPMKSLVVELGEFMFTIDPYFEMSPQINKTISKMYRDTRFSKDKSLFRSNMWITFKRPSQNWTGAPAYFFEIFPDWYRYGMGFYQASKSTMDKFRERINNNPEKFRQVVSFYSTHKTYILEGEKYKRILNESVPDDIQEWYQRKSFYLVSNRKADSILFQRKLIDELIFGFGILASLYQYLIEITSTD